MHTPRPQPSARLAAPAASLVATALCLLSASSTALAAEGDAVSAATVASADATDGVHFWTKEKVAVAGWPTGALGVSMGQLRAPLKRSDSILFQDTYAGVGAKVAASPAFLQAGPTVSLAPVDVFDIDLFAGGISYWPGGFAPLPTDVRGGTLSDDRSARADETVGARGLVLEAAPTLKAKVGRVIVFDAWTVRHQRLDAPQNGADGEAAQPWHYEPFTDLILSWTDTVVEHQPGVLLDVKPDEGGAWLRVGGTMRDKWSTGTGDRSLSAGLLVAAKPGKSATVPTLAGMALMYGIDDDRVGGVPFLGLQASWSAERSLGG